MNWINDAVFYNIYPLGFCGAPRNNDGNQVGGQAVLGRQQDNPTPWLPERHGYDPT